MMDYNETPFIKKCLKIRIQNQQADAIKNERSVPRKRKYSHTILLKNNQYVFGRTQNEKYRLFESANARWICKKRVSCQPPSTGDTRTAANLSGKYTSSLYPVLAIAFG